jgi:hypothetical protein
MPPPVETPPEVLILRRGEILPTTGLKVSICSYSKIGSMNVGMRSISIDKVGKTEALRNERFMFDK